MTRAVSSIRFKAELRHPAQTKGATWSFLNVPRTASAKLPTRGLCTVQGAINAQPFQATLEPDGQKSHWLKVPKKLREAAKAAVGDIVELEIAPVEKEPEPRVPADLRKALAATPKAKTQWSAITAVARRDWIQWIISAKKPETRVRRISTACEMLAGGKRVACCFDRSGFYSKGFRSPG